MRSSFRHFVHESRSFKRVAQSFVSSDQLFLIIVSLVFFFIIFWDINSWFYSAIGDELKNFSCLVFARPENSLTRELLDNFSPSNAEYRPTTVSDGPGETKVVVLDQGFSR